MHWITRARPKIDRVACPWLICRYIDRDATFLFAPADEVIPLAEAKGAIAFDVDGATLSHRGDRCTFDALLDDYGLQDTTLRELAIVIRGADTAKLDLSPQAAGLLAISLGLSRLCVDDDHRMLAHGFLIYDALYEWLRYGRAEQHGWNPGRVGGTGEPSWDSFESSGVAIRISNREVRVEGRQLELSRKEFALLVALVSRSGRVLTRGFLLQHVWAYEADVTTRTVDWHVASLRRQLGTARANLETIRGEGYRWRDEVSSGGSS